MRQQAARRATKEEEKVIDIEDLKRYRKRRQSAEKKKPKRAPRSAERDDRDDLPPERRGQQAAGGHYGLPVLFALLALLALATVLGMNVFQVHDVEVTGNDTISAEDIVKLSGIQIGENIFKVNGTAVRAALQGGGLIEVKSITRVYPDKIVLDIHQRVPHGAIEYMGQYVIVDDQGCVLDITAQLPAGQYPLIVGVPVKHSEKGMPVQSHDERSMEAMQTVLSALQKQDALKYITQADFTDLLNIRLLTAGGLVVELGKPNEMQSKATWLSAALPELNKAGHTKGTLYLTGGKGPVYAPPEQAGDGQNGDNATQAPDNGDDNGEGDGSTQNPDGTA